MGASVGGNRQEERGQKQGTTPQDFHYDLFLPANPLFSVIFNSRTFSFNRGTLLCTRQTKVERQIENSQQIETTDREQNVTHQMHVASCRNNQNSLSERVQSKAMTSLLEFTTEVLFTDKLLLEAPLHRGINNGNVCKEQFAFYLFLKTQCFECVHLLAPSL